MAKLGMDTAVNAGVSVLGMGLGLIGQKAQDKRQREQQKKLNADQAEVQKGLAEHSKEQQMDIWNRTNYGAQKEHMTEAGLNPGLMYGMGGTGGATVGSGTGSSVAGGQAGDPNAGSANQMGMAMMMAQMKNLEANTEKTKAEAEKISTVDTEKVTADTTLQKLEIELKGKTMEDAIKTAKGIASQAISEAYIKTREDEIGSHTFADRVNTIRENAIGALLQNQATKQGIALDQAKIKEITQGIEQRWKALEIDEKGLEVSEENMKRLTETMLWSAGIHATGNLINGILDIRKLGMKGKQDSKNIEDKGFQDRLRDVNRENLRGGY